MLLQIENLSKDFGGIHAVSGLSLNLAEGEILSIIGPNGCGKTTLFNLISGHLAPTAGSIRFQGKDITGRPPHRIARLGMGRKFQVPGIYSGLTVWENLQVPLFAQAGQRGLFGLLSRDQRRQEATSVLEFTGLASKVDRPAGALSHGEKQWLEIGMLLASRCRLLLLDEPTAGMTMAETQMTAKLISQLHRSAELAIIVIEHDLGFVRQLGCPIAVMMKGGLLCRGSYQEVQANPEVREVYLGRKVRC